MTTESIQATAYRAPKPGKKYFSVEEANRALPYVTRVMNDITSCYQGAVELRNRIEHAHPEDDADAMRDQYDNAMDKLNSLIEELNQVGVELKDFEKGLLDFPSVHQDREIYLCWHRGEKSVHAWHEVDAGYAGRQDVATLQNA